MSRNTENKKFGEIAPVTRGRVGLSSILKIFSAAFCLVISLFVIAAVLKRGIERVPPTIQLTQPLNSIGPVGREIAFAAADDGAGIRSISVMVRSGNALEFLKQEELAREKTYTTRFVIDSRKISIPDGPAEIILEVEDDSVWHSKSVMITPVLIDRVQPALELLYVSPKIDYLGTGLAVYRASDRNLKDHGVRVGPDFFAGQPAGNLHPDMGLPGIFATFFAATAEANIRLVATDVAGNETEKIPNVQIVSRQGGHRIALGLGSPESLQELKGLFEREADPERKVAGSLNKDVIAGLAKGMDMGPQVLMGLADIRINRVVQEIVQIVKREPEPIRRWEGVPRMTAMRVKYGFYDTLSYETAKGVLWEGKLNGVVFEPDSPSVNVPNPLRGVVKFAGDLGILGKSVFIDHGFGVVSIYHHLGTIELGVGSFVEIGQAIGTMGATGLALGPQLGLMMVIQGIPVDPRQWLDPGEFQQSILLSLEQARSRVLAR